MSPNHNRTYYGLQFSLVCDHVAHRCMCVAQGQQQAALAALGGLHPPDSLGGPGPPGRGRQTAAGGAPPLAPRAVLGSHRVGILGPGIYRFGSSQPSSSPSQGASPGSLRQSLPNATANAASQHRASGLLGSCVDPLWGRYLHNYCLSILLSQSGFEL